MKDMFKKVAQVIKDNSVVISILCEVFSPSTYRNKDNASTSLQKESRDLDNFPR